MAAEAHVVGVDAGGTKTEWRWLSPHGLTVATGKLPGFNLQTGALEPWARALKQALDQARQAHRLPEPALVVVGAAGVYLPEERRRVETALQRELGVPVEALSDVEIAYYAAHGARPGILLIAGTGSIGLARDEAGTLHRVGGYGLFLDDEGSGAWIVLRALQETLRAADGRGPETRLVDLWLRNQTPRALALKYHRASPGDLARWFPRVMEMAREDPVARRVVDQGVEALIGMVQALRRRFRNPPDRFVVAGGLFQHAVFRAWFQERAQQEGLRPEPLPHPPSWGAARYGLDRLRRENL